jgi:hypothetical protein
VKGRSLGRPTFGREDNIKMVLKWNANVWTRFMAEIAIQWQTVLNMVMNLWVL